MIVTNYTTKGWKENKKGIILLRAHISVYSRHLWGGTFPPQNFEIPPKNFEDFTGTDASMH